MTTEAKRAGPSREEIESLCILHALEPVGASMVDLAARLGLAPGLAPVVAKALEPLVAIGCVETSGDSASATDAGREWLRRRLSELGVG